MSNRRRSRQLDCRVPESDRGRTRQTDHDASERGFSMTTVARVISNNEPYQRLSVTVRGAVQGGGFRPFVYRLATELGLAGWVRNSVQGVFLDVEGGRENLDIFLRRLNDEKPPLSYFQSVESSFLDATGACDFGILASDEDGAKIAVILSDAALFPGCVSRVSDA